MIVNNQEIEFQCPKCGAILMRISRDEHLCVDCDRVYSERELRKYYST